MLLNSQKRIALFFSISSGLLIVLMAFVVILLVRAEVDRQASATLSSVLASVVEEYETDTLTEKESSYQSSNVGKEAYLRSNELPNIDVVSDEALAAEVDLDQLQEIKHVYSRVILPNGDILFTSDLFDSFSVGADALGFEKHSFGDVYVYVLTKELTTGEDAGTIVQVAQYSPFTRGQELRLFGLISASAIVILPLTYLLGLLIAKWLIGPLERTTKKTMEFTQNAYHELLTPITVALTTVDAAKASKKYEKGIKSLGEDLKDVHNVLNVLKDRAVNNTVGSAGTRRTKLAPVIDEIVAKCQKQIKNRQLSLDLADMNRRVTKKVDKAVFALIANNLLVNAFKFAKKGTVVKISLDSKRLLISNMVGDKVKIDRSKLFSRGYRGVGTKNTSGKGLGLAIAKELCEEIGWDIHVCLENSRFTATVTFSNRF